MGTEVGRERGIEALIATSPTEREAALVRAANSLSETCAQRRLGMEVGMHPISYRILMKAVALVARTEQERKDFLAQAEVLAESMLTTNWAAVVALTAKAGRVPIFRPVEDFPDVPIWPLKWLAPDFDGPADISGHDLRVRHLVAHGMVAAKLAGRPISVGFSGYMVMGTTTPYAAVTALIAGPVSEYLDVGELPDDEGCGCGRRAMEIILDTLGIRVEGEGTLSDLLALTGRSAEVHDFYIARHSAAGTLVEQLHGTSLFRDECDRLWRLGRIVIGPADVVAALDRSA